AEQGGYQAAELLAEMMSGRVKERRILLVDALWVVARRSTDVIAVDDCAVAAAIAFIRDNARRPIKVGDVAKQLAVSRRRLEIRFQHGLGRSVREEIERVRLAWAMQLLMETDLPVCKIAKESGFSGASYLCKVFYRATGGTPAAYRCNHRGS
ncbi:MAG: helix-turn-helix domain-containing protein, partial [Thermoguttaceae bacterium]